MIHRLYRQRHDPRGETIWLTIYADLITNLMLVFLALFGLSIMGDDAIARAIQSMKLDDIDKLALEESAFDSIAPALQKNIPLDMDITISEETGAIRLQFGEKILFESARAEAKPEARAIIRDIAQVLRDVPYTIVVEGHTDSVPLRSQAAYRDNWDLSLARAMAITRLLNEAGGIEEAHLAAAAYGAYRPRSSNMTRKGRRINRRVEIALFRDFPRNGMTEPDTAPARQRPRPLLMGADFTKSLPQTRVN